MIRKLSRKSRHQIYRLSDGTIVPGGSTISKIGDDQGHLIKWANKMGHEGVDSQKEMEWSGAVGSIAHHLITCHFPGDEADLSEFAASEIEKGTEIFNRFLKTWAEQELTLISNELQLVSETYRYGGTIDLIARDKNGRLVLADEKSSPSIYGNYYRQVASYENLWNENNEEKIARRVILRHGKKDPEDNEVRWIGPMTKHFNHFLKQLALYQSSKEL